MKENKKESFILYHSIFDQCDEFSNAEFGELVRAIFDYDAHEVIYSGKNPIIRIVFKGYMPLIDSNKRKYAERCEKNKYNALQGWEKRKMHPHAKNADNHNEADAAEYAAASALNDSQSKCAMPEEVRKRIKEILK